MYTQSLSIPDTGSAANAQPLPHLEGTQEEKAFLEQAQARFDAVMQADGKIEPKDWMPEAYRKTLDRKSTRLNSSHIPLSRMPSSA